MKKIKGLIGMLVLFLPLVYGLQIDYNLNGFASNNIINSAMNFLFGGGIVVAYSGSPTPASINVTKFSDTNLSSFTNSTFLNSNDDKLVLYLSFDNKANATIDNSIYKRNLSSSLYTIVEGKYGYAANLSSAGARFNFNKEKFTMLNYSISVWLNLPAYTIDTYNAYHIILTTDVSSPYTEYIDFDSCNYPAYGTCHMSFRVYNTSAVLFRLKASTTTPAQTWFMATATVNTNGTTALYLNGYLNASNYIGTPVAFNSTLFGFSIGNRQPDAAQTYPLNASLDEVMLFNKTLTAEEIASIYTNTYGKFYPRGESVFNVSFPNSSYNHFNISFPDCDIINNSYISFRLNNETERNLTTCSYTNYTFINNLASTLFFYFNSPYGSFTPISYSDFTVTFEADANATKLPSAVSLTFDKTSPQTYGTAITPVCSIVTGNGTTNLSRNGTTITSGVAQILGVNSYYFVCDYIEDADYATSTNTSTFIITQAAPTLSISVSPGTPNNGTLTTVTGTCPAQLTDCILYINGSNVTNPYIDTLNVSTYYIVFNTTGNANYTGSTVNTTFNVIDYVPGAASNTNRDNIINSLVIFVSFFSIIILVIIAGILIGGFGKGNINLEELKTGLLIILSCGLLLAISVIVISAIFN